MAFYHTGFILTKRVLFGAKLLVFLLSKILLYAVKHIRI